MWVKGWVDIIVLVVFGLKVKKSRVVKIVCVVRKKMKSLRGRS